MKVFGESFAGVATAATRVIELYIPEEQQLFYDPFALTLLPPWLQVVFRLVYLPGLREAVLALRERRMPGSLGSILCRTRYIDDVVKRSLEQGFEQVVILGAGFDSRAYRIDGMQQVQVFEVDLPGAVEFKRGRLEKVLGAVPDNVRLIGVDFDRQNLADSLEEAGFQPVMKTLFVWEGVTQYITAEAVSDTLEFVSGLPGEGSAIVFTYVRKGIIDGSDRPEWFGSFLSLAGTLGSPMIFGIDPNEIEGYLAARGFTLVEEVGAAEYQKRYLEPIGRQLNVFDGERAVYAEVKV